MNKRARLKYNLKPEDLCGSCEITPIQHEQIKLWNDSIVLATEMLTELVVSQSEF